MNLISLRAPLRSYMSKLQATGGWSAVSILELRIQPVLDAVFAGGTPALVEGHDAQTTGGKDVDEQLAQLVKDNFSSRAYMISLFKASIRRISRQPLYQYSNKLYQYSNDLERTRTRYEEYAAFPIRFHNGTEIKVVHVRHGLLSDLVKQHGPVLSAQETMGVRFLQKRYVVHEHEHPELYYCCLLVPEKENLARCLESASIHRPVNGSTCSPCEELHQDATVGVCLVIKCYEVGV